MQTSLKPFITAMLICLTAILLNAQDPFFTHFYNNESTYNPALVGYRGAFSFSAKYKSQWNGPATPAFRSGTASLEESMPCSIFDYGLHAAFDEEGSGVFRTYDFGGRLAGTVPFDIGRSRHNLRFGIGLQWSFKTIDYTRLFFSDQLDPKYGRFDRFGNINAGSFIPPNDGRSLWFFSPSVGGAHRILLDNKNRRSPTILYGAALHNAYSLLNDGVSGHEESILGLGTRIPSRYTFFGSIEFIPYMDRRNDFFVGVRPLIMYQYQGGLHYWEAGARVSASRMLALGIYYHFNKSPAQGTNTNWFTLALDFGDIVAGRQRIDLGFAYSASTTGLRNQVGPIFELSMSFHFGKSPSCGLAGEENDLITPAMECPTSAFTPWRRKMYEGIWYKPYNR
jgi:type IX secretion system PorP/SprF family membrane protein